MNPLFLDILRKFLPILVSFGVVIDFFRRAIADPQGFANRFLIGAIDIIAGVFPSTPDNLKVYAILNSASSKMPIVGKNIVYDIAGTIAAISLISLTIKIYKLIPFKAT